MLQNIPTHIIAGPLGAGKTSLLRGLLAQRPDAERWAVLINEFGQIGLDAALLSRDEQGLNIAEVAGGCVCCVNGVPFQVALGRLLRRVRPHRLFIEPSGLGHPRQLLEQLRQAPWREVLDVQPMIMVLDGQSLARGEALPEVHRQGLTQAGLLVINKASAVDSESRLLITEQMPEIERLWTDFGVVDFHRLPGHDVSTDERNRRAPLPVDKRNPAGVLWTNVHSPICEVTAADGSWSIGWRWHPSQQFAPERLAQWLHAWPWKRAKGVIHSAKGWQAFNALAPDPVAWGTSEWRSDSRIELIFDQAQDTQAISDALTACRLLG